MSRLPIHDAQGCTHDRPKCINVERAETAPAPAAEPLRSAVIDDLAMGQFVPGFVAKLPAAVGCIRTLLDVRNLKELDR